MRKLTFLYLIFINFSSYSQVESDKKLDSLMQKFSTQKGVEKAETSKKIGTYYKNNSQYYKAIEYQQIARDLFENAINLSSKEKAKNKALCDVNIGVEYFFIGDHKKAMDYYIKAYKVVPKNIDLLLNLEGVFSSQANLEKAFYYAELAEKAAKKTNNLSQLDRIWSIKSDIYFSKKDSVKAFDALEKSIEFSKKEKDFEQLAITYTNYGDLLKDSDKKIEYFLKSKALWDQYQPNSLLAISNNISIANFYREIAEDGKLQKENKISSIEALNKAEKLLLEQVENCKKSSTEAKIYSTHLNA